MAHWKLYFKQRFPSKRSTASRKAMIDRGLFVCLFLIWVLSVLQQAKAHFKRWVSFRAAAARLRRVGLVDNSAGLVWKWKDAGSWDGDSTNTTVSWCHTETGNHLTRWTSGRISLFRASALSFSVLITVGRPWPKRLFKIVLNSCRLKPELSACRIATVQRWPYWSPEAVSLVGEDVAR